MTAVSRPRFEVALGKPGDLRSGTIVAAFGANGMVELDFRCAGCGTYSLTPTEAIDLQDAIDGALLAPYRTKSECARVASADSAEIAAAAAASQVARPESLAMRSMRVSTRSVWPSKIFISCARRWLSALKIAVTSRASGSSSAIGCAPLGLDNREHSAAGRRLHRRRPAKSLRTPNSA
jgi:hypothetical protein